MITPLRLGAHQKIPADWSSAGIADARAFRLTRADGRVTSDVVHAPAYFTPNKVTARCGAWGFTDRTKNGATWADSTITCPTCTKPR